MRVKGVAYAMAASAVCAMILTGCNDSGDSGSDGKPSASATTTTPAATTPAATPSPPNTSTAAPTTTAARVKLSEKWQPKLTTLDKGSAKCDDPGAYACFQFMSDLLNALTPILSDAQGQVGTTNYINTAQEISKISKAVTDYSQRMCMQNPKAGTPGSPCATDAKTVAEGPTALETAMRSDEAAPVS